MKLFEIIVQRSRGIWESPNKRATDEEGILAAVREAASKPFYRIEICDVSHWNSPDSTSVTLTKDCPNI